MDRRTRWLLGVSQENWMSEHPVETPLLATLERLEVSITLHRHPALFTVEQSKDLRGDIAGEHVKNLLVRDKKRTLWLVVVPEDKAVDLKGLRAVLDTRGGLSFASADLLLETLGVQPGSVTPLAVLNDTAGRVSVVLDVALTTAPVVCCHPLHNAATVQMAGADMVRFLAGVQHSPIVLDVPARDLT
ncbi:MAG: Ala-tRNA(Pro) deacylase [Myxococcota bacterium]|jgi:Ala-tRNA(Pro) deacylase